MRIGLNDRKRRRRLIYAGAGLAAVALATFLLPQKNNGRVTLTFLGYTNLTVTVLHESKVTYEPDVVASVAFLPSITAVEERIETRDVDALVQVTNGTSVPIELLQGVVRTNLLLPIDVSFEDGFRFSDFGPGPLLLKPGQSTNLVVRWIPIGLPWWTEVDYQRRSVMDRQFLRLHNKGGAPLRFIAGLSSKWSEVVPVKTGWITNQPQLWRLPWTYVRRGGDSVEAAPTPVVLGPPVPEPPVATGPIADASDATRRAVRAANDVTERKGYDRPFRVGAKEAVNDGQQWVWRALMAKGSGDLEAIVRLNADGSVDDAVVWFLNSMGL